MKLSFFEAAASIVVAVCLLGRAQSEAGEEEGDTVTLQTKRGHIKGKVKLTQLGYERDRRKQG